MSETLSPNLSFYSRYRRLKDFRQFFGVNAESRIRHRYHDRRFYAAGCLEFGRHRQLAAVGHGIDGVQIEIDQNLRQLCKLALISGNSD
jgi:hypothetical protein